MREREGDERVVRELGDSVDDSVGWSHRRS